MNEQERLEAMMEDIMKDAAFAAAKDIGSQIAEPEEPIAFSAKHEAAMHRIFLAERSKQRRKKWVGYSKKAACILMALIILSSITIFSVDAWKVKFLNFVFHADAPNTDFQFSSPDTSFKNDEVTMGYVPEGFILVQDSSVSSSLDLTFAKEEEYFNFSIIGLDHQFSIDTEDGTIEPIVINGCEGYYITNPRINAIVWHNNMKAFCILGNISKEELVQIAQNIKI